MRGGSLIGTALVLAFALAWASAPARANPQQAGVQVALRALGLYSGPIDGDVGPATVDAIKAAQQRAGLPVTGIADARTRAALGPLGTPLLGTRVLRARDFGLDVAVLQFTLLRDGLYHGALDGYVGKTTEAAIRRYQTHVQLAADGVVGPMTVASLVRRAGVPVRTVPKLAPTPAPKPATTYVVQPGDTLTAIAGRYGVSLGKLAKANDFDPTSPLVVGKELTIPVVAAAPTPSTPAATPAPNPPPATTYVVQPGDTLTAIAGRYGVSLGMLAKANEFDPASALLIGRKLAIPVVALDATPANVRDRLDYWSGRIGVSPSLIRALAWMESGYQPRVVSSAGARGVLQTLPTTRQYVEDVLAGHPIAHDLDGDIEVGVLYLRHLLDVFDGDERLALAAWYQGERAVRASGPYKVTKPFVDDVLALEARM